MPDPLSDFPVILNLPLQWGDQDPYGHVNNVVYLRWCESARVAYLERIGMWVEFSPNGLATILANISCDYRRPLTYPDTVRIGARVTRIGNSSFRMEHAIYSEAQQVTAAEADSTIVVLDYATKRAVRVPDPIREAIAKLEGKPLA